MSRRKAKVIGQRSLGLVPEPYCANGYCSRCNRDYVDIIRHRASGEHRQRNYIAPGPVAKGRPGWMTAIRTAPDDRYAVDDARLAERRTAVYPPAGAGPLWTAYE